MKYSNTALKELSARYGQILRKCAYLNAAILVAASLATPAMAADITTDTTITENVSNQTITGSLYDVSGAKLTLDGVTIDNNTSTSDFIFADATSELVIDNAQIKGNKATENNASVVYTNAKTTVSNNSTFSGNYAVTAAAIYQGSSTDAANVLKITDATFSDNHVNADAGAVAVGKTATMTNVIFTGNTAAIAMDGITPASNTDGGGAIALLQKGNLTIDNGTFTSNKSGDRGGAISARHFAADNGLLKVSNSSFKLNEASDFGGAIASIYDGLVDINATTFTENKAVHSGGAIYIGKDINNGGATPAESTGNGTLKISGVTQFTKNSATGYKETVNGNNVDRSTGGAIYNAGTTTIGDGTNLVTFDKNTASYSGGAIYNAGTGILNINKALFSENEAEQGGAINNSGVVASELGTLKISNSVFKGNKASSGGAIRNQGAAELANVGSSLTEVYGGDFIGNEAQNGGAIWNGARGTMTIETATFSDNKALNGVSNQGGAISNVGTLTLQGSNSFTNNIAGVKGGAIYNHVGGTVSLAGTNTFSGNTAAGKLNDIHNDGTLNIAGDLTLDGGITGTGSITFANNTKLTAKLNATTILANSVSIGSGSTLNLIVDGVLDKTSYDFITATDPISGSFTIGDNTLYTLTMNANGGIDVVKKDAAEAAESITNSTGASAADVDTALAVTSGTSSNESFNNVSNEISNMLQSSDPAVIAAGVQAAAALAPQEASAQQAQATQTANQILSVVSTRLSGGVSSDGESSGDFKLGDGTLWAKALYNKSKLSGDNGFDSRSKGLALGAEAKVSDDVKVGVGYAYSRSDIKPDLSKTEIDSNSALLYAEYKPSNWYVNGIASYTWGRYDETKYSLSNVDSKYNVYTLAMQAMTGYNIHAKAFTLTPEAGVRYMNINQKSHVDSIGSAISGNKSDVFTGVLGAKAVFDWNVTEDVLLKPELRAAVTYDFVRDKAASVMTLANGSVLATEGSALERFGTEFAAGLTTEIADNVELGLFWEGKFRKDYTDNTGMINVKYHF